VIAYPKAFRDEVSQGESENLQQTQSSSKESLEVWRSLTDEVWELAMSNYYFETWMWQFKKVPASLTRLNKLVNKLSEKKTAEIMEGELRIKLDYLKNAAEMISVAEDKIEDTLRALWAKKRELD